MNYPPGVYEFKVSATFTLQSVKREILIPEDLGHDLSSWKELTEDEREMEINEFLTALTFDYVFSDITPKSLN